LSIPKPDVALGFEYAVETINKATIAWRDYISWTVEEGAFPEFFLQMQVMELTFSPFISIRF